VRRGREDLSSAIGRSNKAEKDGLERSLNGVDQKRTTSIDEALRIDREKLDNSPRSRLHLRKKGASPAGI